MAYYTSLENKFSEDSFKALFKSDNVKQVKEITGAPETNFGEILRFSAKPPANEPLQNRDSFKSVFDAAACINVEDLIQYNTLNKNNLEGGSGLINNVPFVRAVSLNKREQQQVEASASLVKGRQAENSSVAAKGVTQRTLTPEEFAESVKASGMFSRG